MKLRITPIFGLAACLAWAGLQSTCDAGEPAPNAAAAPDKIDFVSQIEPLLTRFGCNAGGCHGKASGQNGFKLSLFGFDSDFDYEAIVEEARGRRVFGTAAPSSLFILKAAGKVPHGGGRRIEPGTEAYDTLCSWIAQGAPASAPDAPRVTKIEIEPRELIMQRGGRQTLKVIAHYTNGTKRDVTAQAQYDSNMGPVAAVSPEGLVECGTQSGEAAIMARYMGQVAVFRALVPHGASLTSLPNFQAETAIDKLCAEKWKKLGLTPSSPADDATFIRRVTIDLCGRLPTPEEVRAYLSETSGAKRTRLVDRLLASPDYPAFFAMRWGTILRNSQLAGADRAAYAFHNWIKDMLARNRPYDEFVRGVVAAAGEWQDAPAINWYWQMRDDQLHQVTADTAQVFLGIRLQCARCHHHPYERWGQEDYYGLAGFFTRLGRKSFGEPPPYFSAPRVTMGEQNPLTKKSPEPKYLDGEYAKFSSEEDPRHGLVDWMVRPENPFFSRVLVNRLWGHFFGRGLVDQVDDMRETNPPSNPELLDALAKDFVEHRFDMKYMIRQMVLSQAYGLSAVPTPQNQSDTQNFARFYSRRLIAEVLHDAVDQATGAKSQFSGMAAEARAVDLPHEGFGSYFLETFDRPKRVTGCECERSAGATLAQVLLLSNSDEIENKLAHADGRPARLVKSQQTDADAVDELYLAALSRWPTPAEKTKSIAYLAAGANRQQALEDILWSLLNSKEFLFNH
ncbi:MAG: DUF1553 domain-containing protein [Planctomycetes bacterium]|nr:DUF1553 domain-containing protein [Planctomycetota bacterium]